MTHPYADHAWFDFRTLAQSPRLDWGDGVRVAIHLIVATQSFPVAARTPFPIPGGLDRPYPDLHNWSRRQLGLREGLDRILRLLEETGQAATLALDEHACAATRPLHARLSAPAYSVVAAGRHAACLHTDFTDVSSEVQMIRDVMHNMQEKHGYRVEGWQPPAGAYSPHTLEALAAAGVDTLVDMNNDETPFRLRAGSADMLLVPWQHFASDVHCLHTCRQPIDDYLADIGRAIDWLHTEAGEHDTRLLTLPIHSWLTGVPHRLHRFAGQFRQWAAKEGVRFVGLRDIKAAYLDAA